MTNELSQLLSDNNFTIADFLSTIQLYGDKDDPIIEILSSITPELLAIGSIKYSENSKNVGKRLFLTNPDSIEFEYTQTQLKAEIDKIFFKDSIIFISEFIIYPEYRNVGIANQVMQEFVTEFSESHIWLKIQPFDLKDSKISNNKLTYEQLDAFYQKYGFKHYDFLINDDYRYKV
jgi:ribosomal protein S18 acetylase RimI-like enzyme